VLAHWDGTEETEARIKEETKATIRVIPFDREEEGGKDLLTGEPSEGRVLFARAYCAPGGGLPPAGRQAVAPGDPTALPSGCAARPDRL
jgi:hypothetical protein